MSRSRRSVFPSVRFLAFVLAVALATPSTALAAESAARPEPPPGPRPEVPATEGATLRAERGVAQMLARLDEDLGLETFPDATPLWLARLAASIEGRGNDAPAQALLENLAAELRLLGVEWTLGGPPDRRPDGRPAVSSPEGRERAERVARIRELAELVNRKLGVGGARSDEMAIAPDPNRKPTAAGLGSLVRKYGSDSCASAPSLSLGDTYGYTYSATSDGAASCGGPTPSPDVWYVFTPAQDGTFTFQTTDDYYYGSFDTVLSLHSGCPYLPDDEELACSDDVGATLLSSISYPLSAGVPVWVRVSGYDGATGDYTLRVSLDRTVRGTVTREDDGEPVAGATVEILSYYEYVVARTSTAADGTYLASVPASSERFARVRDERFITELYDDYECAFGTYCDTYYGDPISLTSGDASGIDFALASAGSVAGSVTAADTGQPPPGTTYVEVYDSGGGFVGSASFHDPAVAFEISSLPPGSYYFRASASGYVPEVWPDVSCPYPCDPTTGTLVVVSADAPVTGTDFVLDRLGNIQGVVTVDGTGEPVASTSVWVYDDGGGYAGSDYTGSDGSYEVGGLPEGVYFATTSTSDYLDELYDDLPCEPSCDVATGTGIDVRVNESVTGVDFALVPKASIAGEVTDADTGEPVDVFVYLYDGSGSYVSSRSTGYDPFGSYEFRGLEAGTYHLRTVASYVPTHENELYDDFPCEPSCDVTAGTPVATTATSHLTGIDFALDRRGSISGTIIDAGTGQPLSVLVGAYRLDGDVVTSLYSESDGTYEIRNLAAGDYRVGTGSSTHRNEMYDDVPCRPECDRTTGAQLTVQSKLTTPGIDFALDRLGSLSGRVTDASTGVGLDSVLFLLDAAGDTVRTSYTYSGDFSFLGIHPGTYYLRAREDTYSARYQDEVYPDLPCEPDCDVTQGSPLTFGLGSVLSGYDLALAPCPVESRMELTSTTVSTSFKVLACDLVSAGEVLLSAGADLVLKSGRAVALGDGFRMEGGARLRIVIEPAWNGADD